MQNLPDAVLSQLAMSVLSGFLATLGMIVSEGSMETQDHGPHRVFTVQSKVPPDLEKSTSGYDIFCALSEYLQRHNAIPTAVRLHPYNVEYYTTGGQTYCFTSVYHSA